MEVPSEFPSFAPQGGDKRKLSSAEILARKLSFSAMGDDAVATSSSAQEKLRVVVRARPLQPSEVAADLTLADDAVAVRTVKSTAQGKDSVEEASFFFDRVYRGAASQSDVFDGSMLPQVQALFAGRDTLTFAYGITNAGKTYTIQGKGGADEMGCIPRALEATFCALRHHAAKRAAAADGSVASPEPLTGAAASLELDDKCTYEVKASFLEVYGNDAFDLLATPEPPKRPGLDPPKRAVLRLKEDRGHVFVEGLKEVELPDLESAVRAVSLGWEQRASASNGLNVESSRSHAVLCVKLLTHKPGSDKPAATRLCIVDLAGAERQKKTGMTTQTNGTRLNEAMSINKDLMVLGHCLRDLRYNQLHPKTTQKVPPFRDSRITMLFRDYLSGNGQISVIAAISPRAQDAVGTLDTLKFAAIAQQVKIVEKPKPVERNPVNLPRVAGGAGLPDAKKAKNALAADLVGEESSSSVAAGAAGGYVDEALEAENGQLREQIAALQERLLSAEAQNVAIERSIREEVANEMKEHLEATEAETEQRFELEKHKLEQFYYEKLALVKAAGSERANAASVAAHTEILQHTRDIQRNEAEHAAHIRRLEAELESRKTELETAKGELSEMKVVLEETFSSNAAEIEKATSGVKAELEEVLSAREEMLGALANAVADNKQQAVTIEGLTFQLETEKQSNAGLQKEMAELNARCASLAELRGQPAPAANGGGRRSSKAHKGKAAKTTVADENAEGAAERSSSMSSGLSDATNLASVAEESASEPTSDSKPKKGGFLRGMGLKRSKKGELGESNAEDVYLDMNAGAVPTDPKMMPRETPIARRTRAGRAAA